ncbi:MAG: Maf family nucleotide pyrophosphatase [Candidatus Melainabacteria bacterium]|nr:Maf family nucleotide pyrophosphatase [Candidatus Melainabacteria bacterium]
MVEEIILASGSETRKAMLERAGWSFRQEKSSLDEDELKLKLKDLGLKELGLELAKAKAQGVSKKFPDAYVIGADQICELDGKVFDKPGSPENCIKHLSELSGKTHIQHCCACVYLNDKLVQEFYQQAVLTMRNLSKEEILDYVELEQPLHSAGSYMFERNGHKLFAKVEGKEETILGLPLGQLRDFLAQQGIL